MWLTINASYTVGGIAVEEGSEVHIDFKANGIWNRYTVGNSNKAAIYYTTIANRDDKTTWIVDRGTQGLTFRSKQYLLYYFAVDVLTNGGSEQPPYEIRLIMDSGDIAEWAPRSIGNAGESAMENQYRTNACLHADDGKSFLTDTACAVSIRVVPRWPCYQESYWNDIMAWYSGLSVDLDNNAWLNLMNNGNDITLTTNNFEVWPKNTAPYLRGFQNDQIIFPPQFPTDLYTAIFLTHYPTNSQGRIVECKLSDCAVGHRYGVTGILYQDGSYLTSTIGVNKWWHLISTVKHGYYRSNGYDIKTSGNPSHTVNDQFCINCNGNENSDFDIYDVILINQSIQISDIQCIENYMVNRYAIGLFSRDPTPNPTKVPTQITNNPTPAPTDNPTVAPSDTTNNPTADPTVDPTFDPTSDPSIDPTMDPTADPSMDPTLEPTIDPTINPTIPTAPPTNKPTIQDAQNGAISTKAASGSVTEATTFTTTAKDVGDNAEITDTKNSDTAKNVFFRYMTAFLAGFLGIIIILSFIYSKLIRKNDFYRIIALITASLHILDMVSDVSFSLQITINPEFASSTSLFAIFIGSLIFILLPLSLSIYQLYCVANGKWMKSSNELRGWIHDNIKLLYFLSILTGSSFTGIELCHSNLFNLRQFDIPLSKTELSLFKIKRIYSTLALENVPQIALQIWYIAVIGNSTGDIVYVSMAFSIISIIIAVISMFTQKTIINNMDYSVIQFDVIGSDVISNIDSCKNIVNKPHREMSAILGINKNITEISRPTQTPNGLTVKIKLFISISKAIDLNAEKLMNNAKNNGQIANIFKSSWSLASTPTIENIKYQQINSKIRTDNTVNINVDDENENDSNKMVEIEMNEKMVKDMQMLSDGPRNNDNTMPAIPPIVTDNGDGLKQINSYDSDSSSISNYDENITSRGSTVGNEEGDNIVISSHNN